MRQHAVQQHCASIGCVWYFCYMVRAGSGSKHLPESLRSHTGSCGWLQHCLGSRSSCFGWQKRSPLGHSWSASMSKASWVWAFTCPKFTVYAGVKEGRKRWLGHHCSPLNLSHFGMKSSWRACWANNGGSYHFLDPTTSYVEKGLAGWSRRNIAESTPHK